MIKKLFGARGLEQGENSLVRRAGDPLSQPKTGLARADVVPEQS